MCPEEEVGAVGAGEEVHPHPYSLEGVVVAGEEVHRHSYQLEVAEVVAVVRAV